MCDIWPCLARLSRFGYAGTEPCSTNGWLSDLEQHASLAEGVAGVAEDPRRYPLTFSLAVAAPPPPYPPMADGLNFSGQ